jgi:chorismate dehydratase
MNSVRLGTVPYLNARPLVAQLASGYPGVTLVEAVPSALAKMLDSREVDAALVSSVVALSDPSLCALSAGGVVSDGPVKSIRLMSRVPPAEIRTLALDTSSRTGTVLARVMLHAAFDAVAEVIPMPPDVPAMLKVADAAAIIGDPALRAALELERGNLPEVRYDIDLGSLWRDVTGLPFVYALWTAPRTADTVALNCVLSEAASWGVQHLDEIAEAEADRAGLPVSFCIDYLHDNIQFALGPREWQGLYLFRDKGIELDVLPHCSHSVRVDESTRDRNDQ